MRPFDGKAIFVGHEEMLDLSQENRIKQCRTWLLLGWVTAERLCLCKQLACPAVGSGSKVTFKPLEYNTQSGGSIERGTWSINRIYTSPACSVNCEFSCLLIGVSSTVQHKRTRELLSKHVYVTIQRTTNKPPTRGRISSPDIQGRTRPGISPRVYNRAKSKPPWRATNAATSPPPSRLNCAPSAREICPYVATEIEAPVVKWRNACVSEAMDRCSPRFFRIAGFWRIKNIPSSCS
ncbi:hypothetical protein J6590_044214 [Homalodisca vitripennis]|nr:hypothetical protein J6590_044214 [Homalodisca vitripennis]